MRTNRQRVWEVAAERPNEDEDVGVEVQADVREVSQPLRSNSLRSGALRGGTMRAGCRLLPPGVPQGRHQERLCLHEERHQERSRGHSREERQKSG